MRLPTRFFQAARAKAPATPPPARSLVADIAEAAQAVQAVEAGRGRSGSGKRGVVVAMAATAVVATAAYVWWKRRDQVVATSRTAYEPASASGVSAGAAAVAAEATGAAATETRERYEAEPAPAVQEPAAELASIAEPGPEPAAVGVAAPAVDVEAEVPETDVEDCAAEREPEQQCANTRSAEVRHEVPRPAVAPASTGFARPPALGRFAMPGVRSVVLPSGSPLPPGR